MATHAKVLDVEDATFPNGSSWVMDAYQFRRVREPTAHIRHRSVESEDGHSTSVDSLSLAVTVVVAVMMEAAEVAETLKSPGIRSKMHGGIDARGLDARCYSEEELSSSTAT